MNNNELRNRREELKKMQAMLDSIATILQSGQTIEDDIRDLQQKYIEEGVLEEDTMPISLHQIEEDIIDRYMLANEMLSKFQHKYTV